MCDTYNDCHFLFKSISGLIATIQSKKVNTFFFGNSMRERKMKTCMS